MNNLTYLGILIELIGAGVLIFLGINGTGESNIGLIIGLALVVIGFLLHIFLDKRLNSLPPSK